MNPNSEKVSGDLPDLNSLNEEALQLLKTLISIPSFSGEESHTADQIEFFLNSHHVSTHRKYNNIWCYNKYSDPSKPTLLLNSHHDTVKPNKSYQHDPFEPLVKEENVIELQSGQVIDLEEAMRSGQLMQTETSVNLKNTIHKLHQLFGLGSNDAGGCLVSLIAVFLHFYEIEGLPYNLCLAATAEEETSGDKGLKCILPELGPLSFAIVGEPTQMDMAVAEKGSMVLDCSTFGKHGHAAREEGDNAINKALIDLQWFSSFIFPIEGELESPVKMTVTEINAGLQYNIVPAECNFTVDVRFTHSWTAKEILKTIANHTYCKIKVRPNVMNPSFIDGHHPLVMAGKDIGRKSYCSPTSSDQGWLEIPSMKMGPGDSARSHTADEFIFVEEIKEGIAIYIWLLETLFSNHGKKKNLLVSDNY